MKPLFATREQWLAAFVEALRPTFDSIGHPLPDNVKVSCGWPVTGGLRRSRRKLGEAWSVAASEGGLHETFISPSMDNPAEVGEVLVHELVHHAVGVEHGHRGPFGDCARAIGLAGPLTRATAGPRLREVILEIADTLGQYPHRRLDAKSHHKPQTTRMLKVQCPAVGCGCIVRMTRHWIDTVGAPTCACGVEMLPA